MQDFPNHEDKSISIKGSVVLRAFCSSEYCLLKAKAKIEVPKLNAKKDNWACPDCGHAILWKWMTK